MSETKTIEQIKQDYQFTLSKISHEIRNPVTLINSYLQFIERAHPEAEDFEYWADIQDQMDFLKNLLDELSLYNNSWQLHQKPVHIFSYLEKLMQELNPTYQYLGIRLIYENHIPETDIVLSLDTIKIQQALLNLIRNASESVDKDGVIHIITEKEPGAFLILIRDNGCGIEPEYQSTIFDPFITYKENGTGLGLTIVKQIIQAHGGSIDFSSQPGVETTFILSFPYP